MVEIQPADLAEVRRILAAHAPGLEVRAFGSRVQGGAKPYSDLDLVVYGPLPLSAGSWGDLREAFEVSQLNFRVDVVDVHQLTPKFRALIEVHAEVLQPAANSSAG